MRSRAAFHDGPAAVGTAADEVNHFPGFPAVVGNEDFAGFGVDAELPGVAESVAEDFGAGVGLVDKGIAGRDGIGQFLGGSGVVDVDAEDCSEQIVDSLAGGE